MVTKMFSDGTQILNTNRCEQYPIMYSDEEIAVTDHSVDWSVPIPEVKLLMRYTKWLDRRGFFREDLQCDFEHQIKTFLKDFNVDN